MLYFLPSTARPRPHTGSSFRQLFTRNWVHRKRWPMLWLLLIGWSLSVTAQVCPPVLVAGGNGRGGAPNQLSSPSYVFVDPVSGDLFVSDRNNNRIQKFSPGSSQGVTVAGGNGQGASLNQLNSPRGIVGDGAGNLYVADRSNQRVIKFPPQFNLRYGGHCSGRRQWRGQCPQPTPLSI